MPKVQRYVSTELTHFVGRGKAPEDQYALLLHILRGGWLTHPPHNPNSSGNLSLKRDASISNNEMYSPQISLLLRHSHRMSPYSYNEVQLFRTVFIQRSGGEFAGRVTFID